MARNKPRARMPISERAKQFAPFSPLSGLETALAERERLFMPKRTLDRDAIASINEMLVSLDRGDTVTAFYYDDNDMTYVQKTGVLVLIDEINKTIKISDVTVSFDMLYDLKREADNGGEVI